MKLTGAQYLTALLLLFASNAIAQPDVLWSRTYGGDDDDVCQSIIQTVDDGFALAGYTRSFGSGESDFWLLRTNADGDSLCSKTFGGFSSEWCNSLISLSDGGFMLSGVTFSFGDEGSSFWIVRTDARGDSLWSCIISGIDNGQILETAEGDFILSGSSSRDIENLSDFFIMKIDAHGDEVWSHAYGGELDDFGSTLCQANDGGYLLGGYTLSYGAGDFDFLIIKVNADGDSLWSRTFGGLRSDICVSVLQTSDGGFALSGMTYSFGRGSEQNYWLVKTDVEGDSLWSKAYGGEGSEHCLSSSQTPDYGFVLAGYTDSFGAGGNDFWLLRVNADGDSLWSGTFGGGIDEICHSVAQTADGGFALTGYTNSFGSGKSDFYFVKTSPDPVSVSNSSIQPSTFDLQLFPNPFNSTARLSFSLTTPGRGKVLVLDPSGRITVNLAEGYYSAGPHTLLWQPDVLSNGTYFVRGEFGAESRTIKAMLVR